MMGTPRTRFNHIVVIFMIIFSAIAFGGPESIVDTTALGGNESKDLENGETIHVDAENGDDENGDGSPGDPYRTVGKGVEEAAEGDTISVHPGNYSENLDVDRQVTIRSFTGNPDTVNLTASNVNDHVIDIKADHVTVQDMRIQGASGYAASVYVSGKEQCTISGNNITGSYYGLFVYYGGWNSIRENSIHGTQAAGIQLSQSGNNSFDNNTIRNCGGHGLYLFSSRNNTIYANFVHANNGGIFIDSSSHENTLVRNTITDNIELGLEVRDSNENSIHNNTIQGNSNYGLHLREGQDHHLRDNEIMDNEFDFGIQGSRVDHYRQDIDPTNTVSGKPIYYWVGKKGGIIPSDAGFVCLVDSSNVTVEELELEGNSHGILLVGSRDCMIRENRVRKVEISAIRLDHASDANIVTGNEIIDNDHSGEGITLDSSSGNQVTDNTINGYYYGIRLESEDGSTISGNTVNESKYGLYFLASSQCDITDNFAGWNSYSGYFLTDSNDNDLTENSAQANSQYGICLSRSGQNTIRNNIAQENSYYDIYQVYHRVHSEGYEDNVIENNTGSGDRPILYYNSAVELSGKTVSQLILSNADHSDISNITILGSDSRKNNGLIVIGTDHSSFTNIDSSNNNVGVIFSYSTDNLLESSRFNSNDREGIILWDSCSDNIIRSNTANSNGDDGIDLYYSSDCELQNNTANSNNNRGFTLWSGSNRNTIDKCTANGNSHYGIDLSQANENTITNTTCANNDDFGICLGNSNNNLIYNNILNNSKNAQDMGNNAWNIERTEGLNILGGPYLGGNYWSDYTGNDTDGDGLGDTETPYDSQGDIQNGGDDHPLLTPTPALSVTKVDSMDPVTPGSSFNYTITVANILEDPLTNISITETYPDDVIFLSASPSPTSDTTVWDFSSMEANETITINISVRLEGQPPQKGEIVNTVMAECDQGTSVIVVEPTRISLPVLEIAIEDDPDPVQEGTTLNYSVTITNSGEANATDVMVTGSYHRHLGFISASPVPDTGNDNWFFDKIEVNGTKTLTVELDVSTDAMDENVLTSTFSAACYEGVQAEEAEQTTVAGPKLLPMKLGVIEEEPTDYLLNYTFGIRNTGSGYATNITIVDSYDPYTTYFSSDLPPTQGDNIWIIPRIEGMESFSFNLSVRVNTTVHNGTWIENTAVLSYDQGNESQMKSGTYFIVDNQTEPIPREINITIDELPERIPSDLTLSLSGNITITPDGTVRNASIFFDDVLQGNASLNNLTNLTNMVNMTHFSYLLPLPPTLAEGNHTVRIDVLLETYETATVNFTILHEKEEEPIEHTITITIDPIKQQIQPGGHITISGLINVVPLSPVQSISLLLDGGVVGPLQLENANFSQNITLPEPLVKGNHTVTVQVLLESGESAQKSVQFIYDPGDGKPKNGDGGGSSLGFIIVLLVLLVLCAVAALLFKMGLIPPGGKKDPGKDG